MKLTLILSGLVALVVSGAVLAFQPKAEAPIIAGGTQSNTNYSCAGGVCEYFQAAALRTSTTTPCAIQSPAATSTLGTTFLRLDVSSTSATVWNIAKASTAYATTTALGTAYTVNAGNQAFVQASTAPAAGAATVVAPNSYIVFGVQQGISPGDATGTAFLPVGTCAASFRTPQS